MKHLKLDDLARYSDAVLSRSGEAFTVRFVTPADAGALQAYFTGLTARSRYNRLMGAASGLPDGQLDRFMRVGEADGFSLVATRSHHGRDTIIGEARYSVDEANESVELALSVADGLQGQGIGAALLGNLQCRAAALGAASLFGETLRSNDAMLALARKAGFSFVNVPGDWKQVRFEKRVGLEPAAIPCATWRQFAMQEAAD